jgi:ElaB/YqjD/DUF883 family membrane-anchored ribosome-binding protein
MGTINKAADRAHEALDQAADQAETLANGTEKLLDTASRYIAAHPLRSLAIALAAGYLLNRLTR